MTAIRPRAALAAFAAGLVPLVFAFGVGRIRSHRAAAAPATTPHPRATDLAEAVEEVRALTVVIEGDGIYGSGLLIDPERGLVLTAWHVVSEMRAPRITLFAGPAGPGRIVTRNEKLDLALVEAPWVTRPGLPAPRFGDPRSLRAGMELYAIGAPRRLTFSLSRGIVAYTDREMDGSSYIQLDMAINDGNSGGPVFNARGEVLGVMSFILKRSQGLSFALPIDLALQAMKLSPSPPAVEASFSPQL